MLSRQEKELIKQKLEHCYFSDVDEIINKLSDEDIRDILKMFVFDRISK